MPTLPCGNNGTSDALDGHGTATAIPPTGYTLAADGSQCLAVFADSMVEQAVKSQTTGANQTYVMTWEFAEPSGYNDGWGYTVGLFYSSNSWFLLVNNDTSFDSTHTSGGHYAPPSATRGFNQFSYSFYTDSNSSLTGKVMTLRFGGGTGSKSGSFNMFDNVHLYGKGSGVIGTLPVAIPEPSTIALVVTGAIGMLAYAWRRKRKQ